MEVPFVENFLVKMGKDIIQNVLLPKLDPRDVLNTLATSNSLRNFGTPEVFQKLMRLHYPGYILTEDPRAQYVAILNKCQTTYKFSGVYEFEEEVVNGVPLSASQIGNSCPAEYSINWVLGGKRDYARESLYARYIVQNYMRENGREKEYLNILDKIAQKSKLSREMYRVLAQKKREKIHEKLIILKCTLEMYFEEFFQKITDSRKDKKGSFYLKIMQDAEIQSSIEYYKDPTIYEDTNEDNGEMIFWIYGNPIPKGKTMWLCVLFPHAPNVPHEVIMRETKEEVIHAFLDEYYEHFLDELMNTIPDYLPEEADDWQGDNLEKAEKLLTKDNPRAATLSKQMGLPIFHGRQFSIMSIKTTHSFSLVGLRETALSFSLILFKMVHSDNPLGLFKIFYFK